MDAWCPARSPRFPTPLIRADSSMKPNAWETESRSSGSSNMEPERCARARSCSTGAPMLRRKETTGINQATRMSETGCDREPDPSLCMARDGMRVPYESPERTRKYLGNSPLLVLAQVVCHCSPMADPGVVAPPPRVRGEIRFAPYRLDLDAGLLRSGDRAISLRPKTWAVLRYLAERPGVLVTKEEILDAVWGRITVTEATLTKSIGEIRDALHDEVRHPRFVETVHRRGFRFVSAIGGTGTAHSRLPASPPRPPVHVVAREAEITRLHELLEVAAGGIRQTVFV